MSTTNNLPEAFGKFCAFVLLVPAAISWAGYILQVLWGWFIVPAFGLAALTLPQAIGIDVIVTMLTSHARRASDDSPQFAAAVGRAAVMPAMYLLIGWVARQFA